MSESKFDDVKQALESLIKLIVSDENAVRVEITLDELGEKVSLNVAQEDAGRIIGKKGENIMALRRIMRAVGAKKLARFSLILIEPWRSNVATVN